MGFLGFLVKKNFYISLIISLVIIVIIVIIFFQFIRSYTRHGEALVLPDFTGMTLPEVEQKDYTGTFDFIVMDSIFANDLLPGSIIKQNPSPKSIVKKGRNIYITVVAMTPEMTVMPDLRDLTIRQALSSLKTNRLKIRKLLYKNDMADNAVLGFYFNGDTLQAGDELMSGSEIDLLIGRSNNNPSPVPFLIGRDEHEAIDIIHISSFNTGRIIYWDSVARKDGKVYRQSPEWTDVQYKGNRVSLWLRSPLQFNFDSLIETLLPDSAHMEENIPGIPEDTVIF